MSHDIFGERFFGRREPAWHGLGKTFDGKMGAEQAIVAADLDFQIHKLPLWTSAGGQQIELPGKYAIMREPTHDDPQWQQFGAIVSEDYAFLQNIEVGRALEPLVNTWPVETVGALDNGATIFFSLRAGGMTVGGETIDNYFLATDTRDGGTTMKIALVPIRPVCKNTLVSGLRNATVTVDLAHRNGIRNSMDMYVQLTNQLHGSVAELSRAFNAMAAVRITNEDAAEIFAAAYPYPSRPKKLALVDSVLEDDPEMVPGLYEELTQVEAQWQYYITRANTYRSAAEQLFQTINDEHQRIAETPWAAYNAVVECEDYRNGTGNIGQSALFGYRAAAKRRAFVEAHYIAMEAA